MKTRFTFFICLTFVLGCMWQSCSNDDSITLPEKEREELTMEDVLQMYLDAGFEIDSTATPKGDTFDTPEDALDALREWQEWQNKNRWDNITRSSSYEEAKLHYIQIPEESFRRFYSFGYRQIKVSFTTNGRGDASFETLMGNFYDGPLVGKFEHSEVSFAMIPDPMPVPLPDMGFLMQGTSSVVLEYNGITYRNEWYVIQAYCITQIKDMKVRIWEVQI